MPLLLFYEQLAQVLYESGYERAATKVLIGKQEDRRKYGRLSRWSKVRNWLLGFTIRHGYQPLRALGYALGFVVLGTFLFSWGYSDSFSESLITPSDVKKAIPSDVEKAKLSPPSQPKDKEVSENYPKFNPLVYSFDVFIPIMNLHQQSYWLPNATRGEEISLILFKCKTGSLLRYYFWVHIVFGWILTSLWVAGFTGLVRRAK